MGFKLPLKEMEDIAERDDAALDQLKKRLMGAAAVILVFFGIIVLRLWTLQINSGKEYAQRAYSNRVREREVAAPRGHILDRKGKEIVTNRPSFNVVLIKEDSTNLGDVLTRLSPVLKMDVSELWEKIRKSAGSPKYLPVRLKEDIDWKTLAYLENHNHEFSGIRTEVQPVRVYHYGNLAANTLGYLGIISKKELEKADQKIYKGSDLIGKAGLEKLRERDLRGEKGIYFSEVNARGFEQQLLKSVEPLPGREIHLTLDVELQQIAESYMEAGEKSGAVVAMEVNTGRLLTVVSSPSIRIEDFIGGISVKNWKALLENPKHPLINKVVQASYPPGSTYKMVTALAGLAKGVIDEDTVFYCPGHYRFGNRTYRCWKHSGHGPVNLKKAISQSCDVYFYQVGQRVGVDGLAEFARKLGLGKKTGVEMEHEKSGLVPTKEWKLRVKKKKWQEGETLSIAIGQGFDLVTPLQMCVMTATIANGGKVYRPQLVEKVVDPEGNIVENFKPEIVNELVGLDRFFKLIREGMEEVVQGKRGTARRVAIKNLRIGGKTGTAQVVKIAQYRHLKEANIPYRYRDHAWFTCFAPAEKPEIAVTVLVEHGLHGGSGAGPIARAVLKEYFYNRLHNKEVSEEQ
ncbi:penicillin-binding protein 2 [Desulfomarina profundi]|uniref:Penicillin-binding protein 2 n=1 Tax=Desulfomarina profundi TaxID=2772557 RepID=A0A8D5JQ57_9BACT|nr:penicillin-binding protein 2 [Desulfomarina profundi]BCL59676.1 penicillin-binding protein 2 [Desulfomarina profundi]